MRPGLKSVSIQLLRPDNLGCSPVRLCIIRPKLSFPSFECTCQNNIRLGKVTDVRIRQTKVCLKHPIIRIDIQLFVDGKTFEERLDAPTEVSTFHFPGAELIVAPCESHVERVFTPPCF